MNVTMSDIAEKVGISASTVSRALSAPERVNAETREKILTAARELGYAPSRDVRAPTATSGAGIGLIVPDISNPFFPPIIKAVQERAQARGMHIIIADSEELPSNEFRSARQVSPHCSGMILVSSRLHSSQLEELSSIMPLVLVNRRHPGTPSVSIENAAGIFEAVEHLAALGHTTIAYLNGPKRSWSNERRQEAVRDACAQAQIDLLEFGPFEPQIQAGVRAADLLRASSATAVIAYDDLVALGVMTRLNERGIQVGPELSVIGIDDSPMSGMAYPTLTSITVPGAKAGTLAVDLLLDLIACLDTGEPINPLETDIQLETRLIVRNSTAPPASRK